MPSITFRAHWLEDSGRKSGLGPFCKSFAKRLSDFALDEGEGTLCVWKAMFALEIINNYSASELQIDFIYKELKRCTANHSMILFDVELHCTSECDLLNHLQNQFGDTIKISLSLSYTRSMCMTRGRDEYFIGSTQDSKGSYKYIGSLALRFSNWLKYQAKGTIMQLELIFHVLQSEFGSPSQEKLLALAITSDKNSPTDIIIISGNGHEIPAHKCLLSAYSPVFAAMFENDMVESQTGRVHIADISDEGITALLRCIYNGDLSMAHESPETAFELFYAAHKYDLPYLERLMLKRLLGVNADKIVIALAFRMFAFVKWIDSAHELKTKLFGILRLKRDEVVMLPDFRIIFKEKPFAAMQFFVEFDKTAEITSTDVSSAAELDGATVDQSIGLKELTEYWLNCLIADIVSPFRILL